MRGKASPERPDGRGFSRRTSNTAEKLVAGVAFGPSENDDDWLGHGIYFREYAPQQAWWWAEWRYRNQDAAHGSVTFVQCGPRASDLGVLNEDSAAAILPHLRELRAKHAELTEAVGKVVPLRSPPRHLHAETTIERFRETIRGILLSADQTLAKYHLRFLVERIVVRGNQLEIQGKAAESVALLAASPRTRLPRPINTRPEVLSVEGWCVLAPQQLLK